MAWRSIFRKTTIQCEVSGLAKKTCHCMTRAFFVAKSADYIYQRAKGLYHFERSISRNSLCNPSQLVKTKQDGNVPSRRHILGSKIFKEQLLEKFGKNFFFKKKFLIFRKKYFLGRTMPKNSKRGHSGSFNVFYKPKTSKKFKGVPFDKFRKFSKKVA